MTTPAFQRAVEALMAVPIATKASPSTILLTQQGAEKAVRAVLLAVREVDPAMTSDACPHCNEHDWPKEAWTSYIDAILSESEPSNTLRNKEGFFREG